MLKRTTRHLVVAGMLALAAAAGVGATAASAAGGAQTPHAAATPAARPIVSGDLADVIVHAPGYLGEVIVHAPGDLGEVLVSTARLPGFGQLMASVVVTAQRLSGADDAPSALAANAAPIMAAAR